MKASFVDLRKKSAEVIRALSRNETVTVYYRGTPAAVMHPADRPATDGGVCAKDHPAFGIWSDRDELADPAAHVRRLRRGRFQGNLNGV